MRISACNRIVILGNNVSGKSFFARKLAGITGLPLVHLDVEFWRPNWEVPSEDEWKEKNVELVSKDKRIIDGNVNHGGTMELRFQAADIVIFLDINRFVCLSGVIRRHNKKRSDVPQYLEERFNREYIRFLKGLWNFSKIRKPMIIDLHQRYPHKPFLIISRRSRANKLLKQWRGENT